MKPLAKDELYQNLTSFLKSRGIEFTEGTYAQGIQKSCSLLSDAINLGQQGLEKAKNGIDNQLEQMRQVIHEKTAPKAAQRSRKTRPPSQPKSKSRRRTKGKSSV